MIYDMQNNPKANLVCDRCMKITKGKDTYHWSGIVKGIERNHIHICKNCFKELNLKLEELEWDFST